MNYRGTHGTDETLKVYEDIKQSIRTLMESCITVGTEKVRSKLMRCHDIVTGEDHSRWY